MFFLVFFSLQKFKECDNSKTQEIKNYTKVVSSFDLVNAALFLLCESCMKYARVTSHVQ